MKRTATAKAGCRHGGKTREQRTEIYQRKDFSFRFIFLWCRKVYNTFLTTENRALRLLPIPPLADSANHAVGGSRQRREGGKAIFLTTLFLSWALNLSAWGMIGADTWIYPPQSEVIYQDKFLEINGMRTVSAYFKSRSNADEITAFYRETLVKNGWTEYKYYPFAEPAQGINAFKKEGRLFYVIVFPGLKSLPSEVYLLNSPQELELCNMLKDYLFQEELTDDAAGKDFLDLARYPGSKRRLNIFTEAQGDTLMYEAEGQVQEIAGFYRSILKNSGWKEEEVLTQEAIQANAKIAPELKDDLATLLFYKPNGSSLMLNIYRLPEGTAGSKKSFKRRTIIMIIRDI